MSETELVLISRLPALVDKYNLENAKSLDDRLTHQRLADATGISRSTISRVYRNTFTRLDRHTVVKLCQFFKCGVSDLLVLEERAIEQKAPRKKRKNKS